MTISTYEFALRYFSFHGTTIRRLGKLADSSNFISARQVIELHRSKVKLSTAISAGTRLFEVPVPLQQQGPML